MANLFLVSDHSLGPDLDLSNGGTDVFLDVMTLASCPLANTPWRQNLALMFADGQRDNRGFAGFALDELPWTEDALEEHQFLLAVIDKALTRHGWNLLSYDPPYAQDYLETYRTMLQSFTPLPTASGGLGPRRSFGSWRMSPDADLMRRCPKHDIFQGRWGCRLCDPKLLCEPIR